MKVGPEMQLISDWLSSYPEHHTSDTAYYFTWLMCAFDEADIDRQGS
jgi:hypothetical protein